MTIMPVPLLPPQKIKSSGVRSDEIAPYVMSLWLTSLVSKWIQGISSLE